MRRPVALAVILSTALPAAADVSPQTPLRGFSCEDARTRGFNFYCDQNAVEEEAPEDMADEPPPPPAPKKSYTEQMEDYRKALDELKHRAILEPTRANVQSYMEAQATMVRQAGLFTEAWQRSLFETPALDANVSRPLSQIGENLFQDNLDLERKAAFETATSERALMFVYEGPATCLVCETQGDVLRHLVDQYAVTVLAVTRDGIPLETFPESLIDEGQIETLGLGEVPSPFLALVEPRLGTVDLIGAGLMTQDVILNRVRIITSIPEGGLYDEQAR